MNAELIAVGSELLRFRRKDTNGDWISEQLNRLGCEVSLRSSVEDDAERIASLVRGALHRADLVVITGGLGPTEDDRTREALALALDQPLERDARQLQRLADGFARYGMRLTPDRARQADRPRGAAWIENLLGSAAGLWVEREGTLLVALPGVPGEMKEMFTNSVMPRLAGVVSRALATCTLKICGRTESSVDRRLRDLYDAEGVEATLLSGLEAVELHLRASGRDLDQARARLDAVESRARERLGPDCLGADDDTPASVVGRLLVGAGRSLATAESCTGGWLGAVITQEPGASLWYRGGLVVYDNRLKIALAGVRERTLTAHGAVSEAVARELAQGVRERCGADIGLGITGIAGPGGGTADKPVGLVHLGLQDGNDSLHRELRLVGDRESIRRRAVSLALDRLRRHLLDRA